jgi:hypothetical protein
MATVEDLLHSVGKRIFVRYYEQFKGTLPHHKVVELLVRSEGYEEPATGTRVSNARQIFKSGWEEDALRLICRSKVDVGTRTRARALLAT